MLQFQICLSRQHHHLVVVMGIIFCIAGNWSPQLLNYMFVCLFVCLKRIKSNTSSFVFLCFLSDERYNAVHLPSAGWKIQAKEHTISVWDEGTLTFPFSNEISAQLLLDLCTQWFFLAELWRVFCGSHTHRWANLSSTTCWTVSGSRCRTSPLHSQPGERLTVKTLKWFWYSFSPVHNCLSDSRL